MRIQLKSIKIYPFATEKLSEKKKDKKCKVLVLYGKAITIAEFLASHQGLSESGVNTIPADIEAEYQVESKAEMISSTADKPYDARLCGMTLGVGARRAGGRLVPFFNTSLISPRVVVCGQGFDAGNRGGDPEVDAIALSALPLRRVHTAVSSSGRCFCCQYIVNLHRALHRPEAKSNGERLELELEPRFWQNIDTSSATGK